VSEPKRYQRCYHKDYIPEGMEEHYNGKWVKWEDYASLKAEFDLLDESIKLGPSTIPVSRGYYLWKESEQCALREENARLKADNNRLKEAIADSYKAVDEMEKKFKELEAEFEMHPMAAENARLKKQVERLTKAIDTLIEAGDDMAKDECSRVSYRDWEAATIAAKEGKSQP